MELINNASLRPFITFGVEATCSHLYRISDFDELQLAARYLETPLILGGGSNVLPLGDIQRNVIRLEYKGIEVLSHEGSDVLVRAAGGEIWHDLVLWALDQNLGGIENLSLIPGTVGAAPLQNIGAYGVELDSVFEYLQAIETGTGNVVRFTREECQFGYRDSIFKRKAAGKYLITDVVLRLSEDHKLNTSYGALHDALKAKGYYQLSIRDVSYAVIEIRRSKLPDPSVIGNAGSFFKNPIVPLDQYEALKEQYPDLPGYPERDAHIKIPAAWLIEKAGWKGKREGDAGTHKHQALVLVNYGNATGQELWHFARVIIGSIREMFGIELHPEVNVWS